MHRHTKIHHIDVHTRILIDTPIFIYTERLTVIKEPQIICIYIYTKIYVYIHKIIYIYTNIKNTYTCIHVQMYTHIYIDTHISTHTQNPYTYKDSFE